MRTIPTLLLAAALASAAASAAEDEAAPAGNPAAAPVSEPSGPVDVGRRTGPSQLGFRQRSLLRDVEQALGATNVASRLAEDATSREHLALGVELAPREPTAAAAELVAAVRREPGLGPAWGNLGALLRSRSQWPLAGKCFETALELEPGNPVAQFNMGTWLEYRGKLDDADEAYIRAIELEPRIWSPSVNPLIISTKRSSIALQKYFMRERDKGSLLLDTSAPPLAD